MLYVREIISILAFQSRDLIISITPTEYNSVYHYIIRILKDLSKKLYTNGIFINVSEFHRIICHICNILILVINLTFDFRVLTEETMQ